MESVLTARPFASRAAIPSSAGLACTSMETRGDGGLLVCLRGLGKTAAVYSLTLERSGPPALVFDDPARDEFEAVPVVRRRAPMGHISAMMPGKKTGTVLCLDANFARPSASQCTPRRASRVRIITADQGLLGETSLHADGSFLAEVPADRAFGLETLDEMGNVIHRMAPGLWVRPGENRSCIGCHEPPNRAPRNRRPQAIAAAPVLMTAEATNSGKPQALK
jgi:hypothetical protein